ncbi:uncharacterized protein LOC128721012 [Anopheles nili]|uniref:uncharacterized protein LOC128721012 n=1 Tax=Anopheles nili TaxID=185578 RepID=UPI00237C36B2|nr:uncharacterized protein LOC128721012 [Anopheles nili]
MKRNLATERKKQQTINEHKYWFKIENYLESFQPNIRILKLFGLFPFTIHRYQSRECNSFQALKTDIKLKDITIFILWQTFFLQMLYTSWPQAFFKLPVSRIMIIITFVLYLLAGMDCSISASLTIIFRQKFVHMVGLVQKADELNMQLALIYYYVMRTLHVTSVSAFIAGLYSFRERFQVLNKHIYICFLQQTADGQEVSSNEMLKKLHVLIEIYSKLCDAIRLFCMVFVWLPMMFCATVVITVVFAILAISHVISNPAPILQALAIVYTAITVLFTILFVLLIKFGADLKKEGKKTAMLVHKAINQLSKYPEVVQRLVMFSRFLHYQKPVVSCGLFCFDWTLLFSITSAFATYSIILIQFELGVPKFFISGILQLHHEHNTTHR